MNIFKMRNRLLIMSLLTLTAVVLSACAGNAAYAGAIAYQKVIGESSQIFVMDPEGEIRTRVTEGTGWFFMPSWSPDGEILAFYYFNPGTQMTSVYSVDVTQAEFEQVMLTDKATFDVEFGSLKWSPDGDSILYYTIDVLDIGDIYKIDVASGVVEDVFSDSLFFDYAPDWAPDSTRFVFASNRPDRDEPIFDLYLADPDGANLVQLTNNNNNGWVDTLPAWSPDGETIAFWRYNFISGEEFNGGPEGLWLIDVATQEETLLYLTPLAAEEEPPVWSHDGKYLAFLEPIDDQHTLRVIEVATGELLEIDMVPGDKRTVSWAPDSKALIFSNFSDSTVAMFILDIKSGEMTEVLESEPVSYTHLTLPTN